VLLPGLYRPGVAQLVSGAQAVPLLIRASVVGLHPHFPAVGVSLLNVYMHDVQEPVVSAQVRQFGPQFAQVLGYVEVILYWLLVQVHLFASEL
jgi:hypothetical protein